MKQSEKRQMTHSSQSRYSLRQRITLCNIFGITSDGRPVPVNTQLYCTVGISSYRVTRGNKQIGIELIFSQQYLASHHV